MKITLLTYGSRGDVQPFVALARGLQAAGHCVRLAAPHRFAGFAAEHGVPFAALPGDPEEISARINDAGRNAIKMVRGMADYVFSIAAEVAEAGFAACEDTDLIVHSFLWTTGAHSLARQKGIPDVSLQAFPVFAPTQAFPNVAVANTRPGEGSYFSHWLATKVMWHGGNWGYRQLRSRAPEVFDLKLYWPFDGAGPVRTPLVFAYSPVVIPRPPDWTGSHIHVSGYLFLETPEDWQPPAELADFLAAGEAPVCVTFGSMVNREAERVDGVVRAALRRARQRGIILTGWGGQAPEGRDDDVLYLHGAPHDWLLPRCVAVVHHGGAGTTAAGLRAGIPNIVVPHAVDQPFWGQRVAALGAGPAPIDIKKLNVERLSAAFAQFRGSPMEARAREVGRLIRTEKGVENAVGIIERHAEGFKRAGVR